jgi:hypothetical protein
VDTDTPREITELMESLARQGEELNQSVKGLSQREAARVFAGRGPVMQGAWDDLREDLRRHFSEAWKERRRIGIKHRAGEVKRLLASEPELPDWLRLLPDDLLTPKQREAAVLCGALGLSLQEAATAAGITKSGMRHRAEQVENKVVAHWSEGSGRDFVEEMARGLATRTVQRLVDLGAEPRPVLEALRAILDAMR